MHLSWLHNCAFFLRASSIIIAFVVRCAVYIIVLYACFILSTSHHVCLAAFSSIGDLVFGLPCAPSGTVFVSKAQFIVALNYYCARVDRTNSLHCVVVYVHIFFLVCAGTMLNKVKCLFLLSILLLFFPRNEAQGRCSTGSDNECSQTGMSDG